MSDKGLGQDVEADKKYLRSELPIKWSIPTLKSSMSILMGTSCTISKMDSKRYHNLRFN